MTTILKRLAAIVLGMAVLWALACGGKTPADETTDTGGGKKEAAKEKKAAEPDLAQRIQTEVDAFANELPQDEKGAFSAAITAGKDAGENPHAAFGLMALYTQHLELSGWLYGQALQANPKDPVMMNNFAVILHQKYLATLPPAAGGPGDGTIAPRLALAHDLLDAANQAAPGNAAFLNDLGHVLMSTSTATGDAKHRDEAIGHLKKAVEADPGNATAWARLGQALLAAGRTEEALEALKTARSLQQINGVLMTAMKNLPPEAQASMGRSAAECAVDFKCEANCPRSIIGQLELVSCKMDESSAQMDCQAGKIYATSYNCAEEIPNFGILIPGLNQGFSIVTPWGRLDVLLKNNGTVEYRIKPSVSYDNGRWGPYIENRGTWAPAEGWTAFTSTETSVGFTYNLLGGTPAADMLNEHGLGPASISGEAHLTSGETEVKVEGYGGTIISD